MEECTGKVAVRQGQAIVQPPEGCSEGVGNSGETTTGSSVGLEHHEWFSNLLSDLGRGEVLLNEVDTGGVSEEHGERLLGVVENPTCIHRDQQALEWDKCGIHQY